MGNPFVHAELHANDPDRAKEFYSNLFDWKLEDVPMGDMTYTMVDVGEGTGGGIMKNPVPDTPSHWLVYIQVGDAAASTEKAKESGATVAQEPIEVPSMGWFSIIVDPAGATVGLWQPMGDE